eukprot:Hpha_TRINITY_DN29102_c0_g1::TRINITY_DN29102_c0_g1_i1::g.195383::m.195383
MPIASSADSASSEETRTCFFINTDIRADRSFDPTMNVVRKSLKMAAYVFIAYMLGPNLLFPVVARCIEQRQAPGMEIEAGSHCTHLTRAAIAYCFSLLFLLRVSVQMCVFWARKTAWVEIFAEALGVIPLSLYSLSLAAAETSLTNVVTPMQVLTPIDAAGIFLFFGGNWINLYPEYARHVFKKDPKNRGKLFTGSLYQYCRRPNYSGEVLIMVGFGLASGWPVFNQWIPLAMGTGLAVWSTPEIEFYLARNYGKQWETYRERVQWKMIPGVW